MIDYDENYDKSSDYGLEIMTAMNLITASCFTNNEFIDESTNTESNNVSESSSINDIKNSIEDNLFQNSFGYSFTINVVNY